MRRDIVLALDTATDRLSVAALRLRSGALTVPSLPGGAVADARSDDVAAKAFAVGAEVEVLSECDEDSGRSTSRRLLPVIEEVLDAAGVSVGALGAVVVGVGPGTFTGVRIAVAAARALGLALDVPVLGVPTLAGLAAAGAAALDPSTGGDDSTGPIDASGTVDALVPVVDARRGQVFAGIYRRGAGDRWVREDAYQAVALETLAAQLTSRRSAGALGEPVLLGDASLLATADPAGAWAGTHALHVRAAALVQGQERLGEPGDAPLGCRIAPALIEMMSGGWAAAGGEERPPGSAGTPESVVPLYVRPPDADEHITRMRDPFAA